MRDTKLTRHDGHAESSVLTQLRSLVPPRPLSPREALLITEAQARLLLKAAQIDEPPVPSTVVAELPRIRVVVENSMPCSGSAHWTGQHWVISLNATEPVLRRRFSLFHEYKHIVDHPHRATIYPPERRSSAVLPEQLADFFAGSVLMPKRWLKRLYYVGHTDLEELSSIFAVSTRAVEVRLHQLGLRDLGAACSRPVRSMPGSTYFRASTAPAIGVAA